MFRSKAPIGVDIGSHTVKVCQMRRAGDTFELEKFGMAEIYPGGEPVLDPREQQAAKIEALKRALAQADIKAKYTVSAICGESIIVRYLQLPEMPEDELRRALQWEAEEYIPFRLSEVNLDSQILSRFQDGDHTKMDVLLVSAKKDLVESHLSLIRAAGLEPRIVDVDSFAFLNCFEINHTPAKNECIALVNIGGEITSMNIYCEAASRFSRDIPIGGDSMTIAIKSRMNCSFKEAERLKLSQGAAPVSKGYETPEPDRTPSGSLMSNILGTVEEMTGLGRNDNSPEAVVGKSIQNVLGSLFSEVRRSIEFFENQYRGVNVTRIVLGGGTALLRNLPENFEQELRLPVEIIDPFRRVRLAVHSDLGQQIQANRSQLGVGIGLGIRGLAA